jgi:hypothetical protein
LPAVNGDVKPQKVKQLVRRITTAPDLFISRNGTLPGLIGGGSPSYRGFREIHREVIARHLPAGVVLPDVPAAKPSVAVAPIEMGELGWG